MLKEDATINVVVDLSLFSDIETSFSGWAFLGLFMDGGEPKKLPSLKPVTHILQ